MLERKGSGETTNATSNHTTGREWSICHVNVCFKRDKRGGIGVLKRKGAQGPEGGLAFGCLEMSLN